MVTVGSALLPLILRLSVLLVCQAIARLRHSLYLPEHLPGHRVKREPVPSPRRAPATSERLPFHRCASHVRRPVLRLSGCLHTASPHLPNRPLARGGGTAAEQQDLGPPCRSLILPLLVSRTTQVPPHALSSSTPSPPGRTSPAHGTGSTHSGHNCGGVWCGGCLLAAAGARSVQAANILVTKHSCNPVCHQGSLGNRL